MARRDRRRLGRRRRSPGPIGATSPDARRMAQALRRWGSSRRPRRDPGDEPFPHLTPGTARSAWAACSTPSTRGCSTTAGLHRQPCRGPRPALRQGLRADRRADEAASGRRSSITSASTAGGLDRDFPSTSGSRRGRRLRLGRRRRARPLRPLLHQRHDRQSQGRALRASLDHAPRDAEIAPDIFDLRQHAVVLPIVPMFHANAWGMPWAAPMAGCKLVLSADYRPAQMCRAVP